MRLHRFLPGPTGPTYDDVVAVIHIAQAPAEMAELLDHVRRGDRVIIEENAIPFAILSAAERRLSGRLLSDSLAIARSRSSPVTPDEDFATDVADAIASHDDECIRDPWD